MSALLFGVSPMDPVTYVTVAAGLATVALLATYLPAAVPRAPTRSLRCGRAREDDRALCRASGTMQFPVEEDRLAWLKRGESRPDWLFSSAADTPLNLSNVQRRISVLGLSLILLRTRLWANRLGAHRIPRLVAHQSPAAPRQDGWTPRTTRAVLLALPGGESPDQALIRVDAPADLGTARADGLTQDPLAEGIWRSNEARADRCLGDALKWRGAHSLRGSKSSRGRLRGRKECDEITSLYVRSPGVESR